MTRHGATGALKEEAVSQSKFEVVHATKVGRSTTRAPPVSDSHTLDVIGAYLNKEETTQQLSFSPTSATGLPPN